MGREHSSIAAEAAAERPNTTTLNKEWVRFYLHHAQEQRTHAEVLHRLHSARKRDGLEKEALWSGYWQVVMHQKTLVEGLRDAGGLLHLGCVRIQHDPYTLNRDAEFVVLGGRP